jgi:LPXTG-motif cell wall-anchored protein
MLMTSAHSARRRVAAIGLIGGVLTLGGLPVTTADAAPSKGCKPAKGKPAYPPGKCKRKSISDGHADRGEHLKAYSGEGEFDKGKKVKVELHSTTYSVGTVTVDSSGGATVTFTVPKSMATGAHNVVFTGPFFGRTRSVSVPFSVNKPVGAAHAAGGGLATTGFEIGAASLLGVGLVGAGTAAVLSSRKRKTALPA